MFYSITSRSCIAIAAASLLLISQGCRKSSSDAATGGSTVYRVKAISRPAPGRILVSPYSLNSNDKGAVMILDERGNVLQEKATDGAAFCFRKWEINGTTRYTWIVNDPTIYHIPGINQLTGYVVIADQDLNELKRVHLQPYGTTQTGTVDLDVHDFILLDDDHYIAMSYYPKQVSNIPAALNPSAMVTVVTPVIQEIQGGSVIWQWDASNYPEFYTTSVEGNNFSDSTVAQDYMHMNSMIIDPKDGSLICSFRNLDQVLKINKTTGSIVWRLGGKNSDFTLSSDQTFLRQHNATLVDSNGTLLLFDNGHITDRPYSRVLEIGLNETARTLTSFKSYNIPEAFSQFMGSAQKFGDHYFIGGGTGNYVLEVNPTTGEKLLELQSGQTTYRAYKYE